MSRIVIVILIYHRRKPIDLSYLHILLFVIPASRKRRQKGNPVVSGETASRYNRRLMRAYHWISLFKSYIESQQISL
jgi:hypothetical protein